MLNTQEIKSMGYVQSKIVEDIINKQDKFFFHAVKASLQKHGYDFEDDDSLLAFCKENVTVATHHGKSERVFSVNTYPFMKWHFKNDVDISYDNGSITLTATYGEHEYLDDLKVGDTIDIGGFTTQLKEIKYLPLAEMNTYWFYNERGEYKYNIREGVKKV